jgi:hypothetical protein
VVEKKEGSDPASSAPVVEKKEGSDPASSALVVENKEGSGGSNPDSLAPAIIGEKMKESGGFRNRKRKFQQESHLNRQTGNKRVRKQPLYYGQGQ